MEYNFIVWLKNMICLFLTVLKQFLLTERTHSWSWRVPQTLGKLRVPGSTWASGAHKRHFCQALRWAIYQTTVEVGSKIESACDQYGWSLVLAMRLWTLRKYLHHAHIRGYAHYGCGFFLCASSTCADINAYMALIDIYMHIYVHKCAYISINNGGV